MHAYHLECDPASEMQTMMFTVGNVDRYVDRYIGRHSIDIAIANRSTVDRVAVDIAVDAPRPHIGHMSVVYRPTVGDMSVNCRWHIGQLSVAYKSCVHMKRNEELYELWTW